MTTEIFAPDKGEALQIGENLHSYPLSLGDGLMAGLKFSKVRLVSFFPSLDSLSFLLPISFTSSVVSTICSLLFSSLECFHPCSSKTTKSLKSQDATPSLPTPPSPSSNSLLLPNSNPLPPPPPPYLKPPPFSTPSSSPSLPYPPRSSSETSNSQRSNRVCRRLESPPSSREREFWCVVLLRSWKERMELGRWWR